MSKDEIIELFKGDSGDWEGDNALKGLQIIAKYLDLKDSVIVGAAHDVIYSHSIEFLINLGISDDDLKKLRELNWHIAFGDSLACFV